MSQFEVCMRKLLALKKPSKDQTEELGKYRDEIYKLSQEMQKHIDNYFNVLKILSNSEKMSYPSLFNKYEPSSIIVLKVTSKIYEIFGEKFPDLCMKITLQQVKEALIEDFEENLLKFCQLIYIEIYLNQWNNIEDCLDLYLNPTNIILLKLFDELANKNSKFIPEIENNENHIQYIERIKNIKL